MKYRGHGFWACCLVLAGGLLFAACDDDDPATDSDASMDAMDDSTGGDTTDCCTEAECAASGQVCNTTSCVCETPSEDGCQAVGEVCDPADVQSAAFVCAEDGAGGGICAQACDAASPCPSGSVCTGGSPSFCAESECSGFFDNDCPDAGTKCVPVGNDANFCFANGTTQEGGDCQAHSDCADMLICAGGTCEAPQCSPLSDDQSCETGEECSGLSTNDGDALNLGFCYTTCDPFGDGSECAEGEACSPTERDSESGQLSGVCLDSSGGTQGVGEACSETQLCVDGAICLSSTCRALCDTESSTSGSGACDGTDFCSGLTFNDGSEAEFGACLPTCEPWTDDAQAAGCDSGEWCQPAFDVPDDIDTLGFCESEGSSAIGEACPATEAQAATISSCAAGGYCLLASQPGEGLEGASCSTDDECGGGTCFNGTCESAAECFEVCNPNAESPADPGGDICQGQDACTPLASSDDQGNTEFFDLGTCSASCDFDSGVPCENEAETCIPGEFLVFGDIDLCIEDVPELAERQDCAAQDLDNFAFCDTNSFCIDLSGIPALQDTPGLLCYQVCRFLEAAPAVASIGTGENGTVGLVATASGRAGNDWTVTTQAAQGGDATAASTSIGTGDNGTIDIVADTAGVAGNDWTVTTRAAVPGDAVAASASIGDAGIVDIVADTAGAAGNDWTVTTRAATASAASTTIGDAGVVEIVANTAGTAGNNWTVTVEEQGNNSALSVTIDTANETITVALAKSGNSTDIAENSADAVAAAINAASDADGDPVTASVTTAGNITTVITAQALTGGTDAVLSAFVENGTDIIVELALDGDGNIDGASGANSAANVATAINDAAGGEVTASVATAGSITTETTVNFTGGLDASTGDLAVFVENGTDIIVELALDGDGNIDATADGPNAANTVAAAIDAAAGTDVTATATGTGTDAITAEVSAQSFTGGADAGTGALTVTIENDTNIVISLATDGDGNIDTTEDGPNAAATIAAAINAATDAVEATASGTGAGAITGEATVSFTGGQDAKGPSSKVHPDCDRPTAVCTADAFGVQAGFGICSIDECLNNGTVGCIENSDCCSNSCVDGACVAQ